MASLSDEMKTGRHCRYLMTSRGLATKNRHTLSSNRQQFTYQRAACGLGQNLKQQRIRHSSEREQLVYRHLRCPPTSICPLFLIPEGTLESLGAAEKSVADRYVVGTIYSTLWELLVFYVSSLTWWLTTSLMCLSKAQMGITQVCKIDTSLSLSTRESNRTF